MSIPSSSDEVATSAGSVPALSASSIRCRSSRAIEPWWARASSSPASSLSAVASRSASRRRVHEHDRRAVLSHQLEQARVHRRPDAARLGSGARRAARRSRRVGSRPGRRGAPGRLMSSTGTSTLRSKAFFAPASTIVTGRGFQPRDALAAAEEARDRLERALRGREADPLQRPAADVLEPLEREREVRAALGRDDRVDLVHDHGLDRGEHLARLRGEQQEQRLGRRDQDVGRLAQHARALAGGRVAGADADERHVKALAAPLARRARCRRAGRAGCARRRRPAP